MNNLYLSKTTLAPGIVLYETNPEKVKDLVSEINTSIDKDWSSSKVVNTEDQTNNVDYSSRSCLEYPLSEYDVNKKDIYLKIHNWINPVFLDYKNSYSVESLTSGPYILLKYSSLDKFDAHMDDCAKFPRTVSVSAYLNDDYLGGEIEFPYFNISYKPKVGDILLFSSSFPYLHKVNQITSGTRYAVVNWYRFEGYPISMEKIIGSNS